VLYLISDFIYILLYYVFGYRKKIVLDNISIAFPEKTIEERKGIVKEFYKNLIDTFIETIKMVSMSEEQFDKRCTVNADALNEMAARGKNVQIHSGHQMNWEYANWAFAKHMRIPWIGIYQPIGNSAMNKLFFKMRSRYHSKLISTKDFKNVMHTLFKSQYSIGLAGDQNTNPTSGYWLYFFSKPVPFITGPEKGATKNNAAVFFANFTKGKRGYFHIHTKLVVENAAEVPAGELTRLYRDFLEETIRKDPGNYLWSHRRWRHEYKDEYKDRWIDTRLP